MGQEFIIKSQKLEDKVNQLLPSQGGFQAGVDLSASTTVIPIVDLTETAEGSDVRADLQTALSFDTSTVFSVQNTTTTVINTTGYWRVFGSNSLRIDATSDRAIQHIINDGATDKVLFNYYVENSSDDPKTVVNLFDYNIFLKAGHIFKVTSPADSLSAGVIRQIADIQGNLVDP